MQVAQKFPKILCKMPIEILLLIVYNSYCQVREKPIRVTEKNKKNLKKHLTNRTICAII